LFLFFFIGIETRIDKPHLHIYVDLFIVFFTSWPNIPILPSKPLTLHTSKILSYARYVDNGLHAMGLAVDSKAMQMD